MAGNVNPISDLFSVVGKLLRLIDSEERFRPSPLPRSNSKGSLTHPRDSFVGSRDTEEISKTQSEPNRSKVGLFTLREGTDANNLPPVYSGDVLIGVSFADPLGLFMMLATREFSYSGHMGIVRLEDGEPFVYEAFGYMDFSVPSETLFGKVKGEIRRVPLNSFFAGYDDITILRFPNHEKNKHMAQLAKKAFDDKVPFDPFFDPRTPEPSCPDFIQDLRFGAGYPMDLRNISRTRNASADKALRELGITTPEFLTSQAFVELPGIRVINTLSKYRSPALRQAIIESYRVLHERFNRDGLNIGAYFHLNYKADSEQNILQFRDRLKIFFMTVYKEFESNPTDDPKEIRRKIEGFYEACFPSEDLIKNSR